MKIALVDGQRREAEPGLSGLCPICLSPTVPKCGELRVRHWAHRGLHHCDHWWEGETEWHLAWKNRFPAEWQEIVQRAENGERHIADVKTSQGCVIEFQHSYLQANERRSREAFYRPMNWVANGLRRTRDKPSFYNTLQERQLVRLRPLRFLVSATECALLRDWANSRAGVFFDFGVTQEDIGWFGMPVLWHLSPKSPNGRALLTPVPVVNFVEAHLRGVPVEGIQVKAVEHTPRTRTRPLPGFERYLARKLRARSRQRF